MRAYEEAIHVARHWSAAALLMRHQQAAAVHRVLPVVLPQHRRRRLLLPRFHERMQVKAHVRGLRGRIRTCANVGASARTGALFGTVNHAVGAGVASAPLQLTSLSRPVWP